MARPLQPADVVSSPALEQSGIRHAFFTRRGGVSDGLYDSLNAGIGSKDEPDRVARNRALKADYLGTPVAMLVQPYQRHTADAIVVDAPFTSDRPVADAIVTRTPGLAVGVVTADCGPVLFADPKAGIVAAAHAGWRGATGGILEATLDAMETLGANLHDIIAVLGPTISVAAYEVGDDFVAQARLADPNTADFVGPGQREGKHQFDLPGYILDRLERAGLTAPQWTRHCTYGDEQRFFSYRKTTHRGEADYGRQMSAILLEA